MRAFILYSLLLAVAGRAADNKETAARLARLAVKAERSGQVVRAYMLFAEATARDPRNSSYRANRDALAPAAKILTTAKIENPNIASDVLTAENEAKHPQPPIELTSSSDWQSKSPLQPIPQVRASSSEHDFDLRAPAPALFNQVAAAYGVHAITDKGIQANVPIRFEMQKAGFRAALEGLTAATHTFVFPVNSSTIYFAQDTQAKRDELEPVVALSFPLQEALTERDLIEAANAARSLLSLRTIGWDSLNRMVVVRDRVTRARVARSLMEALLLPRAQVSFDVQFITIDTDRKYQYGATLQTMFQLIDFGKIGGWQTVLPNVVGSSSFGTFGAGASLVGVGIADASAFATYSNSFASTVFKATVVVADRQTANFHIGDQYPIATSLYSGFNQQQRGPSIYDPAPQISMEDLGLVLKITPHVNGEGEIALDLEADFKSLGNQTFNTIPAIAERAFKGSVDIREGQWAIIAGLDSSSITFSRNGLAGIGQIPGIKQLLTQTTRENEDSKTLLVIKPRITRLPVTDGFSPEFLLGPRRGDRVVI